MTTDLFGPFAYRRSERHPDQFEIGFPCPINGVWGIHPTERRPDGEYVYMSVSGIASEAQVRAMAAAPELVEGLEGVADLLRAHVEDVEAGGGGRTSARARAIAKQARRALAALAKAKGDTNGQA